MNTQPRPTMLYRYDAINVSTNSDFPDIEIRLRTFKITKHTSKGVWIAPGDMVYNSHTRWVSNSAKKRFAYPTKAEALESLHYRKYRQVEIVSWQLRCAEVALAQIATMRETTNPDLISPIPDI